MNFFVNVIMNISSNLCFPFKYKFLFCISINKFTIYHVDWKVKFQGKNDFHEILNFGLLWIFYHLVCVFDLNKDNFMSDLHLRIYQTSIFSFEWKENLCKKKKNYFHGIWFEVLFLLLNVNVHLIFLLIFQLKLAIELNSKD